jgi:hypothetical protein
MEEKIARLRAAQDMLRLLLGNADRSEADAVLAEYAVTKLS